MAGFNSIAEIIQSRIENEETIYQVEFDEPDDTQDIKSIQHAGFSSRAPKDSKIIVKRLGDESYKAGIAEDDQIFIQLDEGESQVYSSLSGTVKAFIKFLKTGNLQLNGSGNFAVKYNELLTAFNELQTQYNAHNHGGSGTNATSTADITTVKATTIEMV